MQGTSNPKILGAFLIGFALVAGAYTLNGFGSAPAATTTALYVVGERAPDRVAITVVDSNNDGIEDWRETFVTDVPILNLSEITDPNYQRENTLTEEVSIDFMESVLLSKGYGDFGRPTEQVIQNSVRKMSTRAIDMLYTASDIITTDTTDLSIRSYGNLAASAIIDNSVPGLDNELTLLEDAMLNPSAENLGKLATIANVYQATRDSTLNIPVPDIIIAEHLNLINAYHALYVDISAMAEVSNDPVLTMVRLKRYQDDVDGLVLALRSIYTALEPKASLFTVDDPAVLFLAFSENFPL